MDKKILLEKILPHKRPMILIDEVIDYSLDEKWLRSSVTINKNSKFYDEKTGGISSLVGIEYMAQTIGCYAFYRAKQEKPLIGFLLGTRLYNNKCDIFRENEKLDILVKEIFSDDGIFSFDCFIYNNGDEVASANINVYQNKDIEKDFVNG